MLCWLAYYSQELKAGMQHLTKKLQMWGCMKSKAIHSIQLWRESVLGSVSLQEMSSSCNQELKSSLQAEKSTS